MNKSTIKIFLGVHTWTGLAAGMALFIAFYAGSLTVFFHELEVWDTYHKSSVSEQQSIADAQRLLDLAVEDRPGMVSNLRVYPAETDHPVNVVRWYERLANGTFERHEFRLTEAGSLDTAEDNAQLAGFIYQLHYTAGLPATFGIYVLGIVSLIYGLALVTGLLIFLPNLLSDLFSIRRGKNKKRFWLDAHNAVGVISLPWHMMFAWSSVVLCIGIFTIAPFQLLVFDEDLLDLIGPELGVVQPLEPANESAKMLPLADMLAIAERAAPDFSASQLRFTNYGDRQATVQIFGDSNTQTLLTRVGVTLNGSTGEVLAVSHPNTSGIGATIYNGLIALHYVSFGGYLVKWVYFVLGLSGAFLFYSGNLLWIETRRKRRNPVQPATTVFLAKLNSGVCIGCMAAVSAAFLASRVLMDLDDRGEMTEWAYYAVFLLAIAWCFIRPVSVGTRDLLCACAVLTAAIPVADAVVLGMPVWRSVALEEWPLVCVSVVSLVSAVCFWQMGAAVQKRLKLGDANSVWGGSEANVVPSTLAKSVD